MKPYKHQSINNKRYRESLPFFLINKYIVDSNIINENIEARLLEIKFSEKIIKSSSNNAAYKIRIKKAVDKIISDPLRRRGNTIKPIGGGNWRVREGNYRLIYYPDVKNKEIVLKDFGHRKYVYSK